MLGPVPAPGGELVPHASSPTDSSISSSDLDTEVLSISSISHSHIHLFYFNLFFVSWIDDSLRDHSSMIQAPRSVLSWASPSHSHLRIGTHVPPPPGLPTLRGISMPTPRPSCWPSAGGGGGAFAETPMRGPPRWVSSLRLNADSATTLFTVRLLSSKDWWWIHSSREITTERCLPMGEFFHRPSLTKEHPPRGLFVVDFRFRSPGSVAAVLDEIKFDFSYYIFIKL